MKRSEKSIVSAAGMLVATLTASTAVAREYVYADELPPKHVVNIHGVTPAAEELKSVMKWRISISAELITGKTDIQTVGGGVVDAGFVLSSYHQKAMKDDFTLNDMMYAGRDPLAVNGAALKTHFFDCPECVNDYKKEGALFLGGDSTFDFGLMCNMPIRSVADLKGKKLRTTGAYGRWAQAIGGVPVSMTTDDMVQALERGQIDCIVGPIGWVLQYPIMDSLKTVVDYPFGVFTQIGVWVMNLNTWKSLSIKEKTALLKAMSGISARVIIDGYMKDGDRARETLRKHGVTLFEGKQDFDKIYARFRKEDMKTVIKRAKARGVRNPQHIVDAFLKNLQKWEKLTSGMKRDSATYQKLLWDQIYSRLDPAKL